MKIKLNSLTSKILFLFLCSFISLFIILASVNSIFDKHFIKETSSLLDKNFEQVNYELSMKQEREYRKFLISFSNIIAQRVNNSLSDIFYIESLLGRIFFEIDKKIESEKGDALFSKLEKNKQVYTILDSIIDQTYKSIYQNDFINEVIFLNKNIEVNNSKLTVFLTPSDIDEVNKKIDLNKPFLSYFLGKNNQLIIVSSISFPTKNIPGYICVKIDMNKLIFQLDYFLSQSHINYLAITDKAGQLVYLYRGKDISKKQESDSNESIKLLLKKVFTNLDQNNSNFCTVKGQSGKYYIGSSVIEKTGWKVLLVISSSNIIKGILGLEEKFSSIKNLFLDKYVAFHYKAMMYTFIILLICFIVICFIIMYLIKKSIKPLVRLQKAVSLVGKGRIKQKVPFIKSGDEIESLSVAFNQMTNDLNDYIKNLAHTIKEKEKIEADIKTAAEIQKSALPNQLQYTNKTSEKSIDVFSNCIPSKFVAGDFFDYFIIQNEKMFADENHLFFVIGDVSGKGVPAALFMMTIKTVLKNYICEVSNEYSLKDILMKVSNAIARDNSAFMFATVFCGIVDLKTGQAECVSAAHDPPLLFRQSTETIEVLSMPNSTFLGMPMEGLFFSDISLKFNKGDILFLYTDGLTDFYNKNEVQFGRKKLVDFFNETDKEDISVLSSCLQKNIEEFSSGVPYEDDITYLILKYK